MSPYRSIFDKLIWHTIEALHSSLFGPDGAVNIVTNSINQLHSQWHTIVETNWPMFQNVSNTNSNYLSSIVSIV